MGPGGDGYGWSKRTLVGYSEQMARHLASRFIRVNTIHPTNCNTHLLHNDGLYQIFRPDLQNPTREDAEPAFNFFQAMPIPYVEPEDIANSGALPGQRRVPLHHGSTDPGRRRVVAQVPQRPSQMTCVRRIGMTNAGRPRAVLRPVRLRHRRRPLPGLESGCARRRRSITTKSTTSTRSAVSTT